MVSGPENSDLSDCLYAARLRAVRDVARARRVGSGGSKCLPTAIFSLIPSLGLELHSSLALDQWPFCILHMEKFGFVLRRAVYCWGNETEILLIRGHAVGVLTWRGVSAICDIPRDSAFFIFTARICHFAHASSVIVVGLRGRPMRSTSPLRICSSCGGRPHYPLNRVCIYDGRPSM